MFRMFTIQKPLSYFVTFSRLVHVVLYGNISSWVLFYFSGSRFYKIILVVDLFFLLFFPFLLQVKLFYIFEYFMYY